MDRQQAAESIGAYVDAHAEELYEALSELIRIESQTYHEGEAVQYLAGRMRGFGFDEVRIDRVGNVLGRVGNGKKVILYDAHIDTVAPGDPEKWAHPPLDGVIENGVIHGRGAVDDKGCLMGIAFAGGVLKALSLDGDYTLWVSGSVAEEDVEGSCVEAMLLENPDIRPDYILVAESSEGRIMRGHKGRALIRISIPGKCAHASSAWRGDNALIKALPVIEGIDQWKELPTDPFLGQGTIEVTKVETMAPSLNTIPGEAVITCDRRISCGESIEDLLAEVGRFIGDIDGAHAEIDTEHVTTYTGYGITCTDYFPSWVVAETHPLVLAGQAAYRAVYRKEPVVTKWDFSTNATALCGRQGIPAIGFGPGEEALCHTSDDRLSCDELREAVKFYAALPLFL